MPIAFGCHQCGKQLQARDEFAGRRLKCPGCGTILTIPGGAAAAPPPMLQESPPPPPSSPAAPAVVTFVCVCGRRMKARIADAGSEVECPDCSRSLVIPSEDTDVPPVAPPPPAAVQEEPAEEQNGQPEPIPELQPEPVAPVPTPARAAFNPWIDRSLEQRTAPWKDEDTRQRNADRRRGNSDRVGSDLVGGLQVLLLIVVVVFGIWFWSGLGASEKGGDKAALEAEARAAYAKFTALDLLPVETAGVVVEHFDQQGAEEQQLVFLMPVDPAKPKSPPAWVRLIAGKKPANATVLANNFLGPKHHIEKHQHLTLYVRDAPEPPAPRPGKGIKPPPPPPPPVALWVVNDHLVAEGLRDALLRLIERGPKPELRNPLRLLLAAAPRANQLIAVNLKAFQGRPLPNLPNSLEVYGKPAAVLITRNARPVPVLIFQFTYDTPAQAKAAFKAAEQRRQHVWDALKQKRAEFVNSRRAAWVAVTLLEQVPVAPRPLGQFAIPAVLLAELPAPPPLPPELVNVDVPPPGWKIWSKGNTLHQEFADQPAWPAAQQRFNQLTPWVNHYRFLALTAAPPRK